MEKGFAPGFPLLDIKVVMVAVMGIEECFIILVCREGSVFFNHAYTEAGIPDRKELLSRQAEALERQLIDVKKRLTDIEESDK